MIGIATFSMMGGSEAEIETSAPTNSNTFRGGACARFNATDQCAHRQRSAVPRYPRLAGIQSRGRRFSFELSHRRSWMRRDGNTLAAAQTEARQTWLRERYAIPPRWHRKSISDQHIGSNRVRGSMPARHGGSSQQWEELRRQVVEPSLGYPCKQSCRQENTRNGDAGGVALQSHPKQRCRALHSQSDLHENSFSQGTGGTIRREAWHRLRHLVSPRMEACRGLTHLRELYPESRWNWRRLTGRTQSNAASNEVLIMNGPSLAGGRDA